MKKTNLYLNIMKQKYDQPEDWL